MQVKGKRACEVAGTFGLQLRIVLYHGLANEACEKRGRACTATIAAR